MSAFSVNIVGGVSQAASSATGQGSCQELISGANRAKFSLNNDSQMKGFVAVSHGKRPDDLYLGSPTPWNDLYHTYGWQPVMTSLQFVSATVSSFKSTLQAVNSVMLQNSGTVEGVFHADISKTVTNSTSSSWSSQDAIDVGQKFTYDVSFLGTGGGGETSLNYTHTWGQGGSQSQDVALGTTQGVSVTLQPGRVVYVDLMAYQGTMTVDVVYNATLSGDMAVNYGTPFKGHHFWALDVNEVLSANHKPTSAQITERIQVQFYTSASVVMRDGNDAAQPQRMLWHAAAKPGPVAGAKAAIHVVA